MYAIITTDPLNLIVSYDIETKPPYIIWPDTTITASPNVGMQVNNYTFVNKTIVSNPPTSLHVANGYTLSYDSNTFTLTQTLTWSEPDDMKATARARINAWSTTKQDSGFMFANVEYQSDSISRTTIEGAVQMAIIANMSNTAYNVSWTASDNTQHDMDANTVIQFGVTAALAFQSWHANGVALKAQIMAANTTNDIQTILDSVGA